MAGSSQIDESIETDMADISLQDRNNEQDHAKHAMLQRLSFSDAFFKHQQRGEPDLTAAEKYIIAEDMLSKNKIVFLERFWKYLWVDDISYFEKFSNDYEVNFYLNQIRKSRIGNYDKNRTKNRRYKAMQQLLSEGEYFSEDEMKYRDPFLYEQLVGQYLTDDEIHGRVDKSDLRFSTILFKHIDILQENKTYQDQKDREEGQMEEEEETEDESEESEMENEDDSQTKTIPEEQKATLRHEFLTIMQERFMSGQDEHFNYGEVDNNTEFDDLDILQKDEEEKYFDDEDDRLESDNDEIGSNVPETLKISTKQQYPCINKTLDCVLDSDLKQTIKVNSDYEGESESNNCADQTCS